MKKQILFIFTLLLVIFSLSFLKSNKTSAQGKACGNGVCQASLGENTSTCSIDCGTPPPTSTPTPTPTTPPTTPTPAPSSAPTDSPTTPTDGGSDTSTTNYPTISFSSTPNSITNTSDVSFSGNASVEGSSIELVEYQLNNSSWSSAAGTNSFSFSISGLTDGSYLVRARAKSANNLYTQEPGYASFSFQIITTPPEITINIPEEPTANQDFEISGTFSSGGTVRLIEISLDGGETWVPATIVGNRFFGNFETFDDGNYEIVARAFDNAGNVGTSETQTLIIDTIPPVLGSKIDYIGSVDIYPNTGFLKNVVQNVPFTIASSMRGGPIQVTLYANDQEFPLTQIKNTNLWEGDVSFKNTGINTLELKAIDGAENQIELKVDSYNVLPEGKFLKENGDKIEGAATITPYRYNEELKSWRKWSPEAFGQKNEIASGGGFAYLVPPGKYFLKITFDNYRSGQTNIFELENTGFINPTIYPEKNQKFSIKLPFIGTISIPIPKFIPRTLDSKLDKPLEEEKDSSISIENIDLVDLNGKTVPISNLSEKYVFILNTWSPAASEQANIIDELISSYPELGEKINAIFAQSSVNEVITFLNRGSYEFTSFTDPLGQELSISNLYTVPQLIYIDSSGKAESVQEGILDSKAILNVTNQVR